MCFCATGLVFATTSDNTISPMVDGYYTWKVTSQSVTEYNYGPWRSGPSGAGPATLTLTNGTAGSIAVTNTITGSYSSIANVSKALGVTIGKSVNQSVSYSIFIPSGERRQIIYRPYFKKIKVTEKQYFVDHGISSATGNTKTSYVDVFVRWDYSWKNV